MDTSGSALHEVLKVISADRSAGDRERHAANLSALVAKMQAFGNRRGDPVRMIQSYLGDRWSSLLMHLLHGGMLRHAELRRLIKTVSAEHDISQRMLTLKLRVLERDGLISRSTTCDVPPRVEYRLTDLGETGYGHFAALVQWAERSTATVREAREAYDQRNPDSAAMLRESADDDGL